MNILSVKVLLPYYMTISKFSVHSQRVHCHAEVARSLLCAEFCYIFHVNFVCRVCGVILYYYYLSMLLSNAQTNYCNIGSLSDPLSISLHTQCCRANIIFSSWNFLGSRVCHHCARTHTPLGVWCTILNYKIIPSRANKVLQRYTAHT